jgi:hypothetical protein
MAARRGHKWNRPRTPLGNSSEGEMVHELKLGIGEKSSSDRTVMDRHPVPTDCPLLAFQSVIQGDRDRRKTRDFARRATSRNTREPRERVLKAHA